MRKHYVIHVKPGERLSAIQYLAASSNHWTDFLEVPARRYSSRRHREKEARERVDASSTLEIFRGNKHPRVQ